MCNRSSSVSIAVVNIDFIVMNASIVSVDHRIRPDTVVAVLDHDVQQAAWSSSVLFSVPMNVLKAPGYGKAQVF